MYNKLFAKILDSSIWLESTPTRIVWLTFIAVMDESGFAQFASAANVAHRAIVTVDEAVEAIQTLENPDPESSDPEFDGRRLERVPGGWMVLNAEKHRKLVTRAVIQEQTAERVRRHRAKKNGLTVTDEPLHVTLNSKRNASVTPSEVEAEVETRSEARSDKKKKKKGTTTSAGAARSKRPIYQSDRFVVFEWQLDTLAMTLGPNTDDFDLHAFFDALSKRTRDSGEIVEANEKGSGFWSWLKGEVRSEAIRRGIQSAEKAFEGTLTKQLREATEESLRRHGPTGTRRLPSDV